ncbi:SIMPL domain-containing protein [Halomonas sp. GXIMD04776]|uniref:SIMPL domain-containing protein n=1 Tax=Halomonas sp. GXIMD04776 TaxID=3415605 RepID=UPI003C9C1A3E
MKLIPHSRHVLAGALLLGSLLGGATTAQAQSSMPETQRVQVQAQAEIKAEPDMAMLNARLWERTPTIARTENTPSDPQALADARKRLEERTGELIRTLEQAGLESKSITAGSLSVRPDYVHRPVKKDEPPETLVRTQLERPVSLRIDDLDRLPAILDALTQAGVNALDGVTYDLKDRDAATDKALTQALEKAHHKAQLMASTLGVELGPVLNIQETNAPIFAPRMMAMSAEAKQGGSTPEYRSGEITIDAGVSVAWEIKN